VSNDVIGYGAGVSVEAVVFPHVAVEVTGAHWSFKVPAQVSGLPKVYLGGGVRIGF
jgi:hypothetical protein